MPNTAPAALRQQLETDGYVRVPQVMPPPLLQRLRDYTASILAAQSEEEQAEQRSTGSMISIWDHPIIADLIAMPEALQLLAEMGWRDPRVSGGYIISKPPHSPRLFWHYDYTGYSDPAAFQMPPQQIFLMWYLTDTRPANGCLRVIPGSHVNDNPLIPLLAEAHTDDLRRGKNLDGVEYSDREDEVDVCVQAGDLVMGDSRILHAAHANSSEERRTVITLWYHPELTALPERTHALIASLARGPSQSQSWPEEAWSRVGPMLASYEGDAEPYPRNRNRPHPRPR